MPEQPQAWLIAVAHHKLTDRRRREGARSAKEEEASARLYATGADVGNELMGDDELALIFTCCHPALDRPSRVALTLRTVCGLSTAEVAASFVASEATMAKRLVRAKTKVRRAGIPFRVPSAEALPDRLADVLRVIYLIFTQGHTNVRSHQLIRADLCETAIRLARRLNELLPDSAEAAGLLALVLLTDARRSARLDRAGEQVLLEDQDRSLWDQAKISEGERLLDAALAKGSPGAYQLWAAIAACHSTALHADETDWRQIAALYNELIRYEPTSLVEANRAIAVAMAEGPAAGLVILDTLSSEGPLRRWPQIHVARADLLRRLGRIDDARAAYRLALELEPGPAEAAFIGRHLRALGASDSEPLC